MGHINLEYLAPRVRDLLSYCVTEDYAREIVDTNGFVERVRDDIEQTSAWKDEGFYSASDVRMAVGRVLLAALNNDSKGRES